MDKLVPISQLTLSPDNARRTGKPVDIDVLAALIKSQGLLHNLLVREKGDDRYEIVDGGRRLAALKLLIRSGERPKAEPVPVKVLTPEQQDLEVSLAANLGRIDMHPADTFEAFHRLADGQGATPDAIGVRFGYAASTVRGFLKLANCSPRLMKAFRRDDIALDQMKALAISDDHKKQEAAFFGAPEHFRSPRQLRQRLIDGKIDASDKFARFVGLPAYEQAGGTLTRDLFGGERDVYVDDVDLLHRLAADKLEAEAQTFRDQGWKWVEIVPDFAHANMHGFARVAEQAHGFAPDSHAARLYAGVVLGIERDGELKTLSGLLKPDDAKALARAKSSDTEPPGPSADQPRASGGQLSAPVIEELTAIRTMAIAAEIAVRPDLALAMVVHDLALARFYRPWHALRKLTEIAPHGIDAQSRLSDAASTKASEKLTAELKRWHKRIPAKVLDLWPWLLAQEQATLLSLLAVLTAGNINAIRFRHEKTVPYRIASADRLARTLDLDMTRWWKPEPALLARLSKSSLLAAITEAASAEFARGMDRGSKADLVAVAERKLGKAGWLPTPLRTPDFEPDDEAQADGHDDRNSLHDDVPDAGDDDLNAIDRQAAE
jgi:ParB family chromosome partitioning protein